jgi:DNA-directed RNA polymerase subunit alpha
MIPLPTNIKIIENKDNKALFEIEGLYPGYGVTMGNSLRRVLFSSLEGSAVTQIKIKNASHEFSTIDGVFEDVISIILNIKQLSFKMHSLEPQKLILKNKGEKVVTGADIDLPTQVELMNKDLHIATLTDKKSDFEMELQVERGLGYVSANQEKSEKLEVGQISVDAIFTPIRSVNFRVENMRIGKRTDFDRLFIEIETDGTITPEDALSESANILVDHFSLIRGKQNNEKEKIESVDNIDSKKKEIKKEKIDSGSSEKEDVKIEDLEISSRTLNILTKNNIKKVSGLLKKTEEFLMNLDGMGDKGLNEIKDVVKKLGFELKK